jgi:aspartate carbamoyltransferase catalytic subunit
MEFKGKSIISMNDFSREDIEHVFEVADGFGEIKRKRKSLLKDYVLATLFFTPSTRTRLSFESAMQRLGGGVIGFSDPGGTRAGEHEPLEDTIRVVESYCDVIAMRHNEWGAAALASSCASIPVINGGDGANEHPTQALLDLYTIKKIKGRIDGLKIALVGDLFHLRTLRSLAYGLTRYDVEIYLISPDELKLKPDVMGAVVKSGVRYKEATGYEDIIREIDILYTDYFPKVRFEDLAQYERHKMKYRFDKDSLRSVKNDFIFLHPMPRKDNVGYQVFPDIDGTPYARYFEQVFCGVLTRMALLALVLGEVD